MISRIFFERSKACADQVVSACIACCEAGSACNACYRADRVGSTGNGKEFDAPATRAAAGIAVVTVATGNSLRAAECSAVVTAYAEAFAAAKSTVSAFCADGSRNVHIGL